MTTYEFREPESGITSVHELAATLRQRLALNPVQHNRDRARGTGEGAAGGV
jgi:hypothetical protein